MPSPSASGPSALESDAWEMAPPPAPAKKSASAKPVRLPTRRPGRNPGSGAGLEAFRPAKKSAQASPKTLEKDTVKVEFTLRNGQIDYDIPGEMKLGQPTKCVVRIAGEEVSFDDIKISPTSEHQAVKISDEMSVQLIDVQQGKDFSITSSSSPKQSILDGSYSEWIFYVKPLKNKEGIYVLQLTITAYSGNKKKDIPILEKSICITGATVKRVVFMAADGTGLNLKNEEQKISAQLKSQQSKFHYTKVLDLTALKLVQLLLKEKPNILHYAGHSAIEGIFMYNDEGQQILASTHSLKTIFEASKENLDIDCIMLNSCFSVGQATALRGYTKFMIGTTSKIEDLDAIAFSKAFYQNLLLGLEYKESYDTALAILNIDVNHPDRAAIYKWF